ncbi:MAG: NAD-dependent isocitrate dehydrogenase [Candidatus Lokiarchaeota archaeon]|nr:NAD-dependent isocitrate dehydrogenase [Candidatus Lokiarchaeota archaeon]MBD3340300.1 NAD-dependent isocitrate dehydrogenase [Candidatus Lokiarchaeota archaeon]
MTEENISVLKSPNIEKKEKVVTALGGDGIGPEVINATVGVLKAMKVPGLIIKEMPCGESAMEKYGTAFPDETRNSVDNCDAVLFGAIHETATQVLAYLRWGLGNYANIRPIKYFKGVYTNLKTECVENVNYAFVRENTEGMYASAGKEGKLRKLIKKGLIYKADIERWTRKAVYGLRIVSPKATDRIGEVACQLCEKRKEEGVGKGLLEIVCKPNVLRAQDGMFIERIKKIAKKKYPELKVETYIVDDFAARLIRFPAEHDTIVIPNMMGDILSDEAAQIIGGLGLAGSGVYGSKTPYFEPTHGSAPDITGMNIANPSATIISACMMLDYLGYVNESKNLLKVLENTLAGALEIDKNWKTLPADVVPPNYRKEKKYGSTTDVANKILEEYKKLG